MKGVSQTSISWWHFGFLHKLSQHPQPTHHTLDLQPSTPHLSTPMTTNNNSPCCSQLTAAEAKETLSPWLHQTLALALPSQQNSVNDTTNLSAVPTAQPCLGVPNACPKSWWLQWSVGVRGCLWASTHSCGTAIVCCKGGKSAAKLSPVAIGSACTSHIHTPTCVIFLHKSVTLPVRPHKFLILVSQGADAGVWRSKLTLCL